MDMKPFLAENQYIDYMSPIILAKTEQLFKNLNNDIDKAKIAYEFVRDIIPHSFDINAKMITVKASDVLKHETGICHAKANLLAALLRSQGIAVGFCFQHINLKNDDSLGYAVHCYNAIFVDNHWIKVDANGNTNGKNAQFSMGKPILAYPNRKEYDEYFWNGIYANPHFDTIKILEKAKSLQDIIYNIPDYVNELPDIME